MASKTRERAEFVAILVREYPNVPDLAALLHELMRRATHHGRLQELACNEPVPGGHDARCEARIRKLCAKLPGCVPVFSGDPRGCTVKLRVPSGLTNDWGNVGVCVPQ